MYASLGSEVSVVEFLPSLIPGADQDIVKPLQRRLSKQFKSIMLSSKVVAVKEAEGGDLSVSIESKDGIEELRFEK